MDYKKDIWQFRQEIISSDDKDKFAGCGNLGECQSVQEWIDMGDDVERKGLGTLATRADIIKKLVKDGFMKREKKQMIQRRTLFLF